MNQFSQIFPRLTKIAGRERKQENRLLKEKYLGEENPSSKIKNVMINEKNLKSLKKYIEKLGVERVNLYPLQTKSMLILDTMPEVITFITV